MARSTRQQRRQRRAQAAGTPPLRPTPRPRPTTEEEPPKQPSEPKPERRDEVRSGTPGDPLPPGVLGGAEQGRVAESAAAGQRHRRRHHGLPHHGRLPLSERPGLAVGRPARVPALTEDWSRETTMFRWYVINTYSGHENKVKTNLEHRIESMNQRSRFRRVVVPTEQVIETKDGQKVQAEKRTLPGYVLVNMDLNDDAWTVVKNTPGVTGFVGAGAKPVPLSQPEVDRILHTGAGCGGRAAVAGRVPARRVGQDHLRPARGLRRRDHRRQPRRAEAPGDGQHLRAAGAGRGRIRQRQEAGLRK